MDNDELYHYGILGMHWGVRKSKPSSGLKKSTTDKRGMYISKSVAESKKSKYNFIKNKVNRSKANKKEAEKKQRSLEEKKADVLKSRSAKTLYANADLFTTQELQSAYNRLALERNIQGLAPREVNKGQKYVENTIKAAKMTYQLVDNGTKAYNSIAKIYNASSSGKKDPLTIIGGNEKKKKEDD